MHELLQLGNVSGKVIVEAGHIYTNQTPGLDHLTGTAWGAFISNLLEGLGLEVEKWLFIDNYNPHFSGLPEVLDQSTYLSEIAEHGFNVDKVVYEADMVALAKKKVMEMQNSGNAFEEKGVVKLVKGGVQLYDANKTAPGAHEKGKYSCPLLDACCYLQKLQEADAAVTVLSAGYAQEQKSVIKILKSLQADSTRVFPILYQIGNNPKLGNISAVIQPALAILQYTSGVAESVAKGFGK
ncbi:MAG: hypothetical protein ABIH82_03010 [Candidatus Woesearchaeota archaeon]